MIHPKYESPCLLNSLILNMSLRQQHTHHLSITLLECLQFTAYYLRNVIRYQDNMNEPMNNLIPKVPLKQQHTQWLIMTFKKKKNICNLQYIISKNKVNMNASCLLKSDS
ncbi:hypothetical protein XENTR_v10011288 [Xenopus tropicalis]|nr:hypothetical protein XENTR_v10011288 [Xenopus tropicalis]